MRYFVALMLFFLPARIVGLFCKILHYKNLSINGHNVRVGFSLILADKIELTDNSRIGHLNFIKCKQLVIGGIK